MHQFMGCVTNKTRINRWTVLQTKNAHLQVGVGAFVVNEHQEMLVVQEKNGPLKGQAVWKMPTGLVQQGTNQGKRSLLHESCGDLHPPLSQLLFLTATP